MHDISDPSVTEQPAQPETVVLESSELAYIIRIVESVPEGALPIARFDLPEPCWAIAEPHLPERFLLNSVVESADSARGPELLRVACVAREALQSPEWQSWISSADQPVRLSHKSTEALLTGGKMLLSCIQEARAEVLAALVSFAYLHRDLVGLEKDLKESWSTLKSDLRLTHKVGAEEVKEWERVGRMTEWAGSRRIIIERICPAFDTLAEESPASSRKLIEILMDHFRIEDRLEAVDDQLEVFEDTYELANDRISEFSFFKREWNLEVWIVVILLAEVALMIAELVAIFVTR